MSGAAASPTVVCPEIVCELGEGVLWDDDAGELLWVDLPAGLLHRGAVGPAGVEHLGTIAIDRPLGAVAPAASGGWIVAAGAGFARLHPGGELDWLSEPEGGHPERRMNDGACDPQGRFWAGSLAYDQTPGAGTLYRFDSDGSLEAVLAGTTISNGLGWSRDGSTLFFSDSGTRTVDAFDFDAAGGAIANQRTVIAIDSADGSPDGLTLDAEDCIWVAIWNGAEVRRYTSEGRLIERLAVPVSRPTSCCFGGPGLSTLFISTARSGLTASELREQPDAGRLFAAAVGVGGVAQTPFAG